MANKIEYVDKSWNPIQDVIKGAQGRGYHCTKLSEACMNCWAEQINNRFGNRLPFDTRPAKFEIIPKTLQKPIKRKKPTRYAVQFMGDLFHPYVTFEQIQTVFCIMAVCQQHEFMMLTKRPKQMAEFFRQCEIPKPLDHVWIGVTVENQRHDERILQLKEIPAAHKFISFEPLIGPFNFLPPWLDFIDWVIVGGEAGPGSRPVHPEWIRTIRDECAAAGVPLFFKQWGDYIPSYTAGERSEDQDQYCRTFGQAWVKSKKQWRFKDGIQMVRVGKKAAGHTLDGLEHRELPFTWPPPGRPRA